MTEGREALRAFFAFELPERLQAGIAELQGELRPKVPGLKWARAEGVHLTLRFLGQAPPSQLLEMAQAVKTAASPWRATEARVLGLGTFPERGSPRVLWLGIRVSPDVLALQAAIEEAARKAGFDAETRAFRAHLTLGRFSRANAPRPFLPPVDLGDVLLETVTLFRSELTAGGAVYTPLERICLPRAVG